MEDKKMDKVVIGTWEDFFRCIFQSKKIGNYKTYQSLLKYCFKDNVVKYYNLEYYIKYFRRVKFIYSTYSSVFDFVIYEDSYCKNEYLEINHFKKIGKNVRERIERTVEKEKIIENNPILNKSYFDDIKNIKF